MKAPAPADNDTGGIRGNELPYLEVAKGLLQPHCRPSPERPGRKTNQLAFLQKKVLGVLLKHRAAIPFEKPVDTVKLNIPHYHQIIKRPMDLASIKKRLKNNYYWSAAECIYDFDTMFANCYRFNDPSTPVVQMAKELEQVYRQKLGDMPAKEELLEPGVEYFN